MSRSKGGFVFAALAIILWSTVASAFKLTLKETSFPVMLFWSVIASLLVFTFVNTYHKNWKSIAGISQREILIMLLTGLLNPALYYFVLFKSYSLLPAQVAQPLNYTWPVWLTVMGYFFMNQKFQWRHIPALVLGFAGVVVIAIQQNTLTAQIVPAGIFLALSSALIWSAYWVINLRIRQPAEIKLFFSFISGLVVITIYLAVRGIRPEVSATTLSGSFYVGFFEMGINFLIWLKALESFTNKALLSNMVFLIPFISFVIIHFVVGEKISVASIAGLVLIVSGILVQNMDKIARPDGLKNPELKK